MKDEMAHERQHADDSDCTDGDYFSRQGGFISQIVESEEYSQRTYDHTGVA